MQAEQPHIELAGRRGGQHRGLNIWS